MLERLKVEKGIEWKKSEKVKWSKDVKTSLTTLAL